MPVAEETKIETPPAAPVIPPPAVVVPPAVVPAAATPVPPAVVPPVEPAAPPAPGTKQTASGPPEKYALTVSESDGVSAEALTGFEAEARTLGLTNEAAQAWLDRRIDAVIAQEAADADALKADPVWGGANLAQTQLLGQKALDRFAPKGTPHGDALRGLLKESGRGNAPAVVALLASIGKAMAEDKPIEGGTGAVTQKPKTVADVWYPPKTE